MSDCCDSLSDIFYKFEELHLSSPNRNDRNNSEPNKENSEPNKENMFPSDVKIIEEHNKINNSILRVKDTDGSKETRKCPNPDISCVDVNLIEHSIDTSANNWESVQKINDCPVPAAGSDNEEYLTSEFVNNGHKPESNNTVYDFVIFSPETTKSLAHEAQIQVESVGVELTNVTCFLDNCNTNTQILSTEEKSVDVAENVEPAIISNGNNSSVVEIHISHEADGHDFSETPQKYVIKSSSDIESVNQSNLNIEEITFEKLHAEQVNIETQYTKDTTTTTKSPQVKPFRDCNNIINIAKSTHNNQLENEFILEKNELNNYFTVSTTDSTARTVHDLPNPKHISNSQEQTHAPIDDTNEINNRHCESSLKTDPEVTVYLQLSNSDQTYISSTTNNDSVVSESERYEKCNSFVESHGINCTEDKKLSITKENVDKNCTKLNHEISENYHAETSTSSNHISIDSIEEMAIKNCVSTNFQDKDCCLNQNFSGLGSSKLREEIENEEEYVSVKSDDSTVEKSDIPIKVAAAIQSPRGLLQKVIDTDVKSVQNCMKIAEYAIDKNPYQERTGEADDYIPNILNKNIKITAEIDEKLQQQNSELMLEINAIKQVNTTLELEIAKKDVIILETQAESLKKEQSFQHDLKLLQEQLKEKSNIIERGASKDLEEALKEAEAKQVAALSELNASYCKIMEEYDKTLGARVTDCLKMKQENETATRHLANLELSFSDLHQKYEKAKNIIFGFKKNEETLRQDNSILEECIRNEEKRYESLKAYAKDQIEKSNKEFIQCRDKFEGEISKLNAIVKRLEIKSASLESSLEQKNRECIAIAALCDEVTGKKV